MERRQFVLRHFLHLSVKFGSRSLIDAAGIRKAAQPHRFQHAQHAHGIHVGRKLRRVETHLHMALRRKVINLVGAHLSHHLHNTHRVAHIGIMEVEVRLAFKMRNTLAVIHR